MLFQFRGHNMNLSWPSGPSGSGSLTTHLIKGLTWGNAAYLKGGQCHQCGTKEEGNGGFGNRDHPEAELSLGWGFMVLVLRSPFPLVNSVAFCCETGLYMPSFNMCLE